MGPEKVTPAAAHHISGTSVAPRLPSLNIFFFTFNTAFSCCIAEHPSYAYQITNIDTSIGTETGFNCNRTEDSEG